MSTIQDTMKQRMSFGILGCDPGPTHTAAVYVFLVCDDDNQYKVAEVIGTYFPNERVDDLQRFFHSRESIYQLFLAVEICGAQFKMVGASVFDTAAMGGVVRHLCRPNVDGIYCMRSSEWRHALTGQGNARAPIVYDEIKRFFAPTGGGNDPYKGIAAKPGPLWQMFEAGKGGNAEHLKDALGCALGLTMVNFRSGQSPEQYRRTW